MSRDGIILVVDDNPAVTRFVESILRPSGYKVEKAADGVEALQRVVQGPVDLILLDFVMPRMNGYHFCKALDDKGLAKDVPIVLLTAAEERVYRRMKEHTRVVDFLPKPVKAGILRSVIERNLPSAPQTKEMPIVAEEDDFFEFDLASSDDNISTSNELLASLRDRLQNALAGGMADRLDEIVASTSRDQMLGIIAQIVASTVDDKLLDELIQLVNINSSKPGF